jgi:hypothetical protein
MSPTNRSMSSRELIASSGERIDLFRQLTDGFVETGRLVTCNRVTG